MANRNSDIHGKTSRLNTPRGSAGSSRQREHKSNVKGRYASLDASSINGSWAQRAAEARKANEERARNSGRKSEYEQRAREARNRQFNNEQPQRDRSRRVDDEPVTWDRARRADAEPAARDRLRRHDDEQATRELPWQSNDSQVSRQRSTGSYDQNDSVSRLFEHRSTYDEYGSGERTISSYEREARVRRWREQVEQQERENAVGHQERSASRADRRTVKLGERPELDNERETGYGYAQDFSQEHEQDFSQDYPQSDYAEELDVDEREYYEEPNYEQEIGAGGRIRGLVGAAAETARNSSPAARIIAAAIVVIIIAAILYVVFAGGTQTAKNTSAASSSSSVSSSSSASKSAATSQGVADMWTDSGTFSTGDAQLDAYVKDLCDSESSKNASAAENAYKGYIAVAWSEYVERDNDQDPQGPDWARTYAKQWFEAGNSGNCYELSAVTQYVLQYFGYSDAKAEPCLVELESGEWGDHGLVFVTDITTGQKKICDDALGTNGWMLDEDALNYKIKDIGQNR